MHSWALDDKTEGDLSTKEYRYIGCGINQIDSTVFVTINGQMVPWYWRYKSHRRWYPFIQVLCGRGLLIDTKWNLGSEPFQFEHANEPSWTWDHKDIANRVDWGGKHGLEFSDNDGIAIPLTWPEVIKKNGQCSDRTFLSKA